jgi:putative signal transducing protein
MVPPRPVAGSLRPERAAVLASRLQPVSTVTLTVVGDEMEAEVVCGLLRANGIKCSYRSTGASLGAGAAGTLGMAGSTEVLVDDHDLEAAQQLLSD